MAIKYTRKNNHDLHKKVTKQPQSNPHWSSSRKTIILNGNFVTERRKGMIGHKTDKQKKSRLLINKTTNNPD